MLTDLLNRYSGDSSEWSIRGSEEMAYACHKIISKQIKMDYTLISRRNFSNLEEHVFEEICNCVFRKPELWD